MHGFVWSSSRANTMAGMTVQVTPIGGPQKEAKAPDRPPPVSVPGFWTAFPRYRDQVEVIFEREFVVMTTNG